MCGRINVSDNEGVRVLLESLGMDTWPGRDPRFNIAPTQTLDTVQWQDEAPALVPMSWGVTLTQSGKSGKVITKRIQNSRSDKVWFSRMWKGLVAHQRVLVPVNGFYEWQREKGKIRATYYITPTDQPAMFFGGLYQNTTEDGEKPEVSIVTTAANKAMRKVHDRMPVILGSQNAAMAWLKEDDRGSLDELMQPAANSVLKFTEVGSYVNKSTNEGPECIQPIAQ